MITLTLLAIGILVFMIKIIFVVLNAAWSVAKGALFIVGLPLILVGLLVAGLVHIAAPLLVIGLVAAFVVPALKQI